RHVDLSSQRRRRHGDRYAAEDIGTVALEEVVWPDRQEDVKVSRRSAPHARLALAREPDLGAVLHPCRNIDGERPLLHNAPGARAGGAGIADDFAAPLAAWTGSLDGEKALARPHLAVARAGWTRGWPHAGGGAGAGAGGAGHAGGDADLRRLARVGFG